jgi:hypothetical protein
VAWCAGTTLDVQGPGGTTSVQTAGARAALQALGFSFRLDPQVSCAAVAPLATSTGAPAGVAAAFSGTRAAGGPPFYLAALVTRDGGRTWVPIPVPPGSGAAGFGGFRYRGAQLQALFARRIEGAPAAYPEFGATRVATEIFSADGQSWRHAPLTCPPLGPCATFDAYQLGNCAMNGTFQTLLRSTDGGARWPLLTFPDPVQACGEAELAITSRRGEVLVDSTGTYPVLRTTDGGATWQDVAIPRRAGMGELAMLPDGELLMAHGLGDQGRWQLLRRGARRWCTVRTPAPAIQRRTQITPVTVIANQLWWLTGPPDNPEASPVVNQLPVAALSC